MTSRGGFGAHFLRELRHVAGTGMNLNAIARRMKRFRRSYIMAPVFLIRKA